jgi:hypothetical protein
MNRLFLCIVPCVLLILVSCNRKDDAGRNVVTKRIQYDVPIVSPEPDLDWWVQNLEGSTRETVIKDIIGAATSGRVKAYDFFTYRLLTPDDVKNVFRRTDTVAIEQPDPPHELVDTVLVHELSQKDITRLRFLEEWRMDKNTLAFEKKVVGICPLAASFTETGELKGYKPLFWLFFDEQYPDELKGK